jgi:hypothetical protein
VVTLFLGDTFQGLKDFLRMCGEHTRAELLVEPQPRKCYYNARQRLRKRRLEFPRFLDQIDTKALDTDKLISDMMSSIGSFQNATLLGQEDWGRNLIIYKKNADVVALCSDDSEFNDGDN